MTESNDTPETNATPSKRRRNVILALVLAAASLAMYFSIFVRLTVNPLE